MRYLTSLCFYLLFINYNWGQVTIADALPGCITVANQEGMGCGGGSTSFGINGAGVFEATNVDGITCCAAGGDFEAYFEFETINLACVNTFTINLDYSAFGGPFEDDSPGAPVFGCQGANPPDNSHDQMVFTYSIDGGPEVQDLYVHGTSVADFTGTWVAAGLTGTSTLDIKVYMSNKASNESFFFQNLDVVATPAFSAGPNLSSCNNVVTLNGSGSGGTWSGGSGTFGDINDPGTTYTPAPSEFGQTITLTYTCASATGACMPVSDEMMLTLFSGPTISWVNTMESFCENDCVNIPYVITGGTGPYTISFQGTVQLIGILDINADCTFTTSGSGVIEICLTHNPITIIPPSAGYNCNNATNTLELPTNLLDWISPNSGPLEFTSITDSGGCAGTYVGPDVVVTYLDNCDPFCTSIQPCDDGDPCTENDMATIGGDGVEECVPCMGTPVSDCTLPSIMAPCNDNDPCTENDMIELDPCNLAIECVPCQGTPIVACANTLLQPCDDGDDCTENDMEEVDSCDVTNVCVPCTGTPVADCTLPPVDMPCDDGDPCTENDMQPTDPCNSSVTCGPCQGTIVASCLNTIMQPCDDGDDCTENDMVEVDACDQSVTCVPCGGTPIDCNSPGATTFIACDDGDPNTENDLQEVLDCDNNVICGPCMGTPTDCDNNSTTVESCDDMNPCTINDEQTVLDSDGTICEPCMGEPLDCNNGATTTSPCDDGDPNTINDMITTLDCDGSICEPCMGEQTDCDNNSTTVESCDDMNPCTINDEQTVLDSDGSICEPCMGDPIDCNNGATTTMPCDDGDPNTIDDMVTTLDCDGSVCVPCMGTETDCDNNSTTVESCDDMNPCTINDEQTILDSDGSICEPCMGDPIDCMTGATTTLPCDDGDPTTINDMVTTLDCDGSVCVPCEGVSTDCMTGATMVISCDDGNPCTINDEQTVLTSDPTVICEPCIGVDVPCAQDAQCEQTVPCDDMDPCTENDVRVILLSDGSECMPCAGTTVDCDNGQTTTMPCDDMDPTTENDMVTTLDCNGSVCEPCQGTPIPCNLLVVTQQVSCNDFGTPNDPTDDIFSVTLQVTNGSLNGQYTVDQNGAGGIIPFGNYGQDLVFDFGLGSAGAGDVLLTITDLIDSDCTIDIMLTDPGDCAVDPDCMTGTIISQPCDDMDPCTENDEEGVLSNDPTIVCEPCAGTLMDCSNGMTTTSSCDDGNPLTFDDVITTLDCDGSVCVPCQGNLEEVNVFIPNVFNTNSDFGNDGFRIFSNQDLTLNYMYIFDRWGNQVFSVENVNINAEEARWDGRFNKEKVVSGVYAVVLEYQFNQFIKKESSDILVLH